MFIYLQWGNAFNSNLPIQQMKRSMLWIFRHLPVLLFLSTIEYGTAIDQCRTEVNIQGMALKRSVFKRWSVAAPHLCDVKCGQEITCQSYNYNRKHKICELNNRTKEARPENFLSAPAWFYIRRLNGRGKWGEIRARCIFLIRTLISNTLYPWPTPSLLGLSLPIFCFFLLLYTLLQIEGRFAPDKKGSHLKDIVVLLLLLLELR